MIYHARCSRGAFFRCTLTQNTSNTTPHGSCGIIQTYHRQRNDCGVCTRHQCHKTRAHSIVMKGICSSFCARAHVVAQIAFHQYGVSCSLSQFGEADAGENRFTVTFDFCWFCLLCTRACVSVRVYIHTLIDTYTNPPRYKRMICMCTAASVWRRKPVVHAHEIALITD